VAALVAEAFTVPFFYFLFLHAQVTLDGFRQLLDEHSADFHAHFTLSELEKKVENDSRWVIVDEKDREALFDEKMTPFRKEIEDKKKAELEKAKKDFIDLLKENSVNGSTHWSRVKTKIDRDTRYKSNLLNSTDKEGLFKEYVQSLEEDSEKRRKRDREEASKRDREREIKELRERESRELDKRREKQKREEDEVNFASLLSEKIKEPNITWKDALKMLDSDPRFKTHHLARDDKDRIFKDHLKSLYESRLKDFKTLLTETELDVSLDWKHAKDLIRDDKRYTRVTSERDKVTIFERHMRDVRRTARDRFKELLKETKQITHTTPTEGPQLEKAKSLIRGDKRYTVWDSDKEERQRLFKEYIEQLQKEHQSNLQKQKDTAEKGTAATAGEK